MPESLKTPKVLYILSLEREKILSRQEFIARRQSAPLSEDSIYDLVLKVTDSVEQAEKARAFFVLEQHRGK